MAWYCGLRGIKLLQEKNYEIEIKLEIKVGLISYLNPQCSLRLYWRVDEIR
jgi:hypothetical protein